jgi:hypothetical protein
MLVGDHGRVIPFRHFKALAITLCVGFILMLIAIIVMAILYTHQMKKLTALHSRLSEVQQQNSKLRDEKDLYLTRLMLKENKRTAKSEKPAPKKPAQAATPEPARVKEKTKEPKKPASTEKQATKNKWMADIRKFSVSYDAKQEILKAQFRIYNMSKPKKPLSGRSVIVFKVPDEPPLKWMSVPQVQLKGGKPPADKGQPFQIRNYFTMRFRAYRQKAPIQYNAVTAYVFSEEGKLLASKDLAVKIEVPLPEKKEPPKPAPVVEKKPEVPVQETIESSSGISKEEFAPAAAPSGERGGTGAGTALPEPDAGSTQTQPATEKETAPKIPAGEASEDSSPINSPVRETEKEPLAAPNSPETVPKP